VTTPLPLRFREQVWRRIERAEFPAPSLGGAVRAWIATVFARPAFAFTYVSVLLIIGVTLGALQAREKIAQWERQLEARYVQSINPYEKGQK
jgi:hypothetical protein